MLSYYPQSAVLNTCLTLGHCSVLIKALMPLIKSSISDTQRYDKVTLSKNDRGRKYISLLLFL